MQETKNVTYAKPNFAGAISVAPLGTTLPTNAVDTLATGFESLGYISEDGLTNSMESDIETIKAWGGDSVLVIKESSEDTFSYTLIEMLNKKVLEFVFGKENVIGDDVETGLEIKVNNADVEDVALVIDMILKGGYLKRIVIPQATITELGEINYVDNEAVGYEVTVLATPYKDYEGDTHREYLQKATTEGVEAGE